MTPFALQVCKACLEGLTRPEFLHPLFLEQVIKIESGTVPLFDQRGLGLFVADKKVAKVGFLAV
jgi:hypothetical protein